MSQDVFFCFFLFVFFVCVFLSNAIDISLSIYLTSCLSLKEMMLLSFPWTWQWLWNTSMHKESSTKTLSQQMSW